MSRRIHPRVRFYVFQRDNFTCQYCGRSAPDVMIEPDHVVPRAKGGTDHPDNLVAACKECNGGKGDFAFDADGRLLPEIRARARIRVDGFHSLYRVEGGYKPFGDLTEGDMLRIILCLREEAARLGREATQLAALRRRVLHAEAYQVADVL